MTISQDVAITVPKRHEFMFPVLQVLSQHDRLSRRELYTATTTAMGSQTSRPASPLHPGRRRF